MFYKKNQDWVITNCRVVKPFVLICQKNFLIKKDFDLFLNALENVLKKWFDEHNRKYMYFVSDRYGKQHKLIEIYSSYKDIFSKKCEEIKEIKPLLEQIDELYDCF